MSPSPTLQVMFAFAFSWIIAGYVRILILLALRPLFTCRVQAALVSGACGALRLVDGRHNTAGVSLREWRNTTQVMLGVSLRARLYNYNQRNYARHNTLEYESRVRIQSPNSLRKYYEPALGSAKEWVSGILCCIYKTTSTTTNFNPSNWDRWTKKCFDGM